MSHRSGDGAKRSGGGQDRPRSRSFAGFLRWAVAEVNNNPDPDERARVGDLIALLVGAALFFTFIGTSTGLAVGLAVAAGGGFAVLGRRWSATAFLFHRERPESAPTLRRMLIGIPLAALGVGVVLFGTVLLLAILASF